MTWATTNWTNYDWSQAAILNEFVGAVNERKSVLGQGEPFATVNAGDDVQAATLFRAYQNWIESNLFSFVVSHDAGVARSSGHFDGEVIIPAYASLAEVFSAAGLAHANWRRYTTHPDEAGVVGYGQMQVGDIIGPWIFEDIQKCLNVLVWIRWGCGIVGGDTYQGVGVDTDWETAKAKAEANWARKGDGWNPVTFSDSWAIGANLYAELYRSTGNFFVEDVWNGINRSADWYIKATKRTVFDAYGDDVIEDKYSFWLADEPANGDTTIESSAEFGDASVKPNNPWCDSPTSERGWDSYIEQMVVIRWNVSGGLTYV